MGRNSAERGPGCLHQGEGGLIRLVEDFDQVEDLDKCALGGQTLAIWMMQPGLAVTTAWAPVARTFGDLARLQALRHLRLVRLYVRRATAPISLGQRHHGESGNWARRARGSRLIFWPCTM